MSEQHIGTCSECGGKVVKHVGSWSGVNPPEARCTRCGAGERKPVIPMGGGKPFSSYRNKGASHER